MPGQLITVQDPDDPTVLLRFIPEPGNTGTGGGAYLLLDACPACSRPDSAPGEVPTAVDRRAWPTSAIRDCVAGGDLELDPIRYRSSSSTTPHTHPTARSDSRPPTGRNEARGTHSTASTSRTYAHLAAEVDTACSTLSRPLKQGRR